MQINVIARAKRNMVFGVLNQVILMLCPFVERRIIQRVLGVEYLGLGSLFTSILTVLSLTEMGFGSAMVYHMYKPAGEGNVARVNALLSFYRKVYRIIGLVIIAVGLLLIPFLPKLINGSCPDGINLTALYLIYLGNTALSYFLYAYMYSILVVHQRDDVKSLINSIVKLGLTSLQVLILLLTKNYYLFSLLMPVFTLLNNLLIALRVRQLYPQYRPEGSLAASDTADIRRVVSGTFIQQACGATRNSLDSICISAFLGLTLTGIYSNYYVVFNSVILFTGIILSSFMGGIGNHVAVRTVEENYQEMKKLDFVFLWLGGWCSICMLCLYQPFMTLWMGEDMLLPMSAVVLLCVYSYMLKMGDIRSLYSSANGLWWEQRYRALSETALNFLLNITLGKLFGVHGIIAATMISLFLCNHLWAVQILFKHYFTPARKRDYYAYQARQSALTVIAAAATYFLCAAIPVVKPLPQFIIRLVICIVFPNLIFFLVYRKTESFQYAKNLILKRH